MLVRLFGFLIFIFLFCSNFSHARELKVVTFNTNLLCIGPGCLFIKAPDVDKRTVEIARYLRDLNADIVFLQEIWQRKQFEEILKTSHMPYGVFGGSDTDLAIFSKFPITNNVFTPFHWQASHEFHCKAMTIGLRMGLLTAEVLVDGSPITVATGHLLPRDHSIDGYHKPSDEVTLERQLHLLEALSSLKKKTGSKPLIIAGDFNMNQASDEYAFWNKTVLASNTLTDNLKSKFILTSRDGEKRWRESCTYCDDNSFVKQQGETGEGILDYIFTRTDNFDVLDSKILHETGKYSDHLAVASRLRTKFSKTDFSYTPVEPSEMGLITKHIEDVSIHPLCWLSYFDLYNQRDSSVEFLKTNTN